MSVSITPNPNVVGPQGIQGLTGSQGTTGTQGTSGTNGTNGAQGTTGLQGTQGLQGTLGLQGTTGLQGTSGSTYLAPTLGSTAIDSGATVTTINGMTKLVSEAFVELNASSQEQDLALMNIMGGWN